MTNSSIVETLSSGKTEAAEFLQKCAPQTGLLDLSEDALWPKSFSIIEGVDFDKVCLKGVVISPNFVCCRFRDSEFHDLKTDGHFWSSGNTWLRCKISNSVLQSIISPKNKFVECIFDQVVFDGYSAYETLFQACQFVRCSFRSMRSEPNRSKHWSIPCMQNVNTSLQFIDCEFVESNFSSCVFRDTGFRSSKFISTFAAQCDFSDINADQKWWSNSSQVDVFLSFLDQVIDSISSRLGKNVNSVAALTRYRNDYCSGANTSKDYSSCLYTGHIPDDELDVVEKILDKLGPKLPL